MEESNALLIGGWLQGVGIGAVMGLVAPVGDGPVLYAVAVVAVALALGGYYLERTAR